MSQRESILRCLRRSGSGRVGFEFVLSPGLEAEFQRRTGKMDYREHYGFPARYVELQPTRLTTDFTRFFGPLPAGTRPLDWNPEWGVMGAPGPTAHFQEMLHPMAGFEATTQVEQYPFPDFTADYRWAGVAEQVESMRKADRVALAFMEMTIFEIAWYLRGMDRFMEELLGGEPLAEALLDVLTDMRVEMARRYALAGVDVLMLGDDVATQLGMMISPALWRATMKPRLASVIAAARKARPEVLIFYHGDGNMEQIVPELIEIGVDILNPVQPECMDPKAIKQKYGDRLTFWGCVGTQSTMPFGTPDDVRRTCRELVRVVGEGGGLFLAPTHTLEPDVPWENVEAFLDVAREQ